MSRLEKTLERKSKKKKFRIIKKIVFIFLLVINATVCICIVDLNAKKMLGQEIQIQDSVDNIKQYIDNVMKNINNLSSNIKEQINR